jgi:hypothetical protein
MSAIRSLSGVERTSCGRSNLVEIDPFQTSATSAQQFSSIMQAGPGRGYCFALIHIKLFLP